jgi:hypothetical protein
MCSMGFRHRQQVFGKQQKIDECPSSIFSTESAPIAAGRNSPIRARARKAISTSAIRLPAGAAAW